MASIAGGGLSVNYSNDDVTPTLAEYAHALSLANPEVFSSLNTTSYTTSSAGGGKRGSVVGPKIAIITGFPFHHSYLFLFVFLTSVLLNRTIIHTNVLTN